MTLCTICNAPAVKRFTWFNASENGPGAGQQGGAMCEPCMSHTWDALSRFPTARETVTIWPLEVSA